MLYIIHFTGVCLIPKGVQIFFQVFIALHKKKSLAVSTINNDNTYTYFCMKLSS